MSQFQAPPVPVIRRQKDAKGRSFIDYKQVEELRRAMTQNGKMLSRKRMNMSAGDQSQLAQAIKRARFMALLPFTNAAN
ncbi:MAG: 30S ribosomal protein S18 [Phycisphaerae bacterium]|nr:30S ribosomal protein S18 [Phycisphaerae bacterium]